MLLTYVNCRTFTMNQIHGNQSCQHWAFHRKILMVTTLVMTLLHISIMNRTHGNQWHHLQDHLPVILFDHDYDNNYQHYDYNYNYNNDPWQHTPSWRSISSLVTGSWSHSWGSCGCFKYLSDISSFTKWLVNMWLNFTDWSYIIYHRPDL